MSGELPQDSIAPANAVELANSDYVTGHYCPEVDAIEVGQAMLADPANDGLFPGEGYKEAQRLRLGRACAAFKIAGKNCSGETTEGLCPVGKVGWGAVGAVSVQPAVLRPVDLPATGTKSGEDGISATNTGQYL